MPRITMEKTELYDLIKRAVREVLEEELFKQRLEKLDLVSDEEVREIEQSYGRPSAQEKASRIENIDV
ncbi:MAG: hypothetical protein WCA08_20015 [Desulfoferrobacter sp.]